MQHPWETARARGTARPGRIDPASFGSWRSNVVRDVDERAGRVVTRAALRAGIKRSGGPGVSNVTAMTLLVLVRDDLGMPPSVNGAVVH